MINIRDALDFLERAKSSAENIERYAYDCDFREARLVILELIAEVERLRSHHIQIMGKIRAWILNDCAEVCRGFDWRDEEISRQREEIAAKDARIKELEAEVEAKNKQIKELQDIIDKPPEEADWVADYHLLQSALDGPIIDAARKWHAAYRKAQNSNLMRAKEVERLRSAVETWEQANSDLIAGLKAGATEVIAKDARIKELEGMIKQLGSLAFMADYTPLDQIIAHFMSWGQSNYEYTSRLEVAFLRSNAAMRYYQEGNRGPWPQLGEKFKEPYQEKAREALERIKEGGKDMPS